MVNGVSIQPSGSHQEQQTRSLSTAAEIKRQTRRAWSHSQIGHRSEYSVERLLAFRDYYQRTSFARVFAVCFLTPIPALFVTLAIDLIPLKPPSEGWQENYAMWLRLLISTFAISLGLIAQVKEVIVAQTISNFGAFKIAIATSIVYVGVSIVIAASWRYPIPFGYVLLVGPYVSIFSFFTVLEIGPRVLAQSLILRQQIKSQLQIVATQGVVAVAYPLFSAVFNRLTGVEQTTFVMVMPLIKFVTKQIIANAAESLDEYVGPIVVFSVDVFNVFYIAICMQAATSTVTTLLIIASDNFHVIVALRTIFQRKYDVRPHVRGLSYYLNDLPIMVHMLFRESEAARRYIRVQAPFPLSLSKESRIFIENLNNLATHDVHSKQIESASMVFGNQLAIQGVPPIPKMPTLKHHRVIHVNPRGMMPKRPGSFSSKSGDNMFATRKIELSKPTQQSALHALQTLFHSEYVLMAEYIEFMLPVLYALYLAVLFHLPVAAYYPHTSMMTRQKLQATLVNILAFSTVEFVTFIGLVLLLRRKFGFSPLYQLAFVLETQANTLQGHLFVWTPFILQLTLVHYGVDFTFRFS